MKVVKTFPASPSCGTSKGNRFEHANDERIIAPNSLCVVATPLIEMSHGEKRLKEQLR
jgi:hypothetical protein